MATTLSFLLPIQGYRMQLFGVFKQKAIGPMRYNSLNVYWIRILQRIQSNV